MSSPESRYGQLPSISEHIMEKVLEEVNAFASFLKHDPNGAKNQVESDINWVKENKDFLGRAIETSVNSALEIYSDRMTHSDWVELQLLLLKDVLLLLQALNEALKEN